MLNRPPSTVAWMGGLALAVAGVGHGRLLAAETAGDAAELFEQRIRPLLVDRCQKCHGEKIAEAGLRLDSRAGLLAGSDSGPVVVPGDAKGSRLVAAVRHEEGLEMPPDGQLAEDEIAVFERWVAAGAAWGTGAGDDPPAAAAGPALMEERLARAMRDHWSFRSPLRHDPPASTLNGGRIDRFIAAGLAQAGLEPASEAEPRVLLRRLWFDLTGLPPPAAEVERFAAAPAEEAYRAVVERLLASPECAEHWARKWLDIARYADSPGYIGDQVLKPKYPFAWTYRDWVVNSLADDLPLDRFIELQLAADHCQEAAADRPAAGRGDLAALGFLTVGRALGEHERIDDVIDVVTRGLMGLTVTCARCHDHKYEPIAAADYYGLHGVFASTTLPAELPIIGEPAPGPDAVAFQTRYAELTATVATLRREARDRVAREALAHVADYLEEFASPRPPAADGRPPRLADGYEFQRLVMERVRGMLDNVPDDDPVFGAWKAALQPDAAGDVAERLDRWLAERSRAGAGDRANPLVVEAAAEERPRSIRELAELYARLAIRVAPVWAGGPAPAGDEPAAVGALRKALGEPGTPFVPTLEDADRVMRQTERNELRKAQAAVAAHEADARGGPARAMAVADRPTPIDSPVFLRGDPGRRGPTVERRLPRLLGGGPLPRGSSGRLELARAIVADDNPLTPRVLVNWAWTHHFGRGLVETAGDFGLRGDPPTHRELLDDLARRFVEEGRWSLRWLHREIVGSRTWRRASRGTARQAEADPENRLLSRANVRRLDWEPWRDSLLAAAGTLDVARRGGPGMDCDAPDAAARRTLYLAVDRQFLPGLMRTFDIAPPDFCTHVRSRTVVPQQSLAVLNAPLVVAAARGRAARTGEQAGDDAGRRIAALWRHALGREPDADEAALARDWLAREATGGEAAPQFGAWERLAQAVLATAEFEYVD
ncbi:MAG: PSD1 and planctomycete cytochrome C domain-containing protein [Planctomycetia bacterium]